MNTTWVSHFKHTIFSEKAKYYLKLSALFLAMIVLGAALALYADSPWLIVPFLGALALTSFAALEYALYILVAFLPFSFRFIMLSSTEMQVPTEPLLAIVSLALILRWIIMKRSRMLHIRFPFRYPIILYGIALCLSLINSENVYSSAKGVLRALAYVMLAVVVFSVITDRKRLKWLFIVSIAPATVAVGWTMIFLIDRLEMWRWSSAYEGLPFTSYMHYGAFVAVILLILLARFIFDRGKYDRVIWTLLLGFFSAAICLSFSRGVWVSFIVAAGFLMLQRSAGVQHKRILIVGGALAFFAILLSIPHISGLITARVMSIVSLRHGTNRERILRWGTAFMMFLRHPIIGCGYGSFAFSFVNDPRLIAPHLMQYGMGGHSEYLQALAETGLIGFSAWIWIIISFFLYGFRLLGKLKESDFLWRSLVIGVMAAELSLLVHFLVNNLLQADIIGVPFWLLMGLLPAIGNIVEKENQPSAKG
jgi:putative inorganic carbon (HCO3(-)) transporter